MTARAKEWDEWMRVGAHIERNLVIEAEGLRLVRYRVEAGASMPVHTHSSAQIDVVVSGTGTHRVVLAVEKNGRTRRVTTEVTVGPGDCFYIPSRTPHGFDSDPRRPVVLVDIMIPPTARAPARPVTRRRRAAARSGRA